MKRLLFLWLTWTVLPCCRGNEVSYEYEDGVTATPDYDYNATFEYEFYQNNTSDYGEYEVRMPENNADEASAMDQLLLLGLAIAHVCH